VGAGKKMGIHDHDHDHDHEHEAEQSTAKHETQAQDKMSHHPSGKLKAADGHQTGGSLGQQRRIGSAGPWLMPDVDGTREPEPERNHHESNEHRIGREP
jgi:hypothetical protein